MLNYVLFILGFILLIKGADWMVDGAVALSRKFKISKMVIGLTIVAFGTSAPEFVVSVLASIKGTSGIVIGNIIGSNIANVLLVLGISAVIFPIVVKKSTAFREIPFSVLAGVLVLIVANDTFFDSSVLSVISRVDGFIFFIFFAMYLYYLFSITKTNENMLDIDEGVKKLSRKRSILFIILGLVALIIGGKWIVEGGIFIAGQLGVGESAIALSLIALGTSLPELATSLVSIYKKHGDIALGNIIGSNIFNIFWVLGFSAIMKPLYFESSLNVDILMSIFASFLLFAILYIGKKRIIKRWQGILMLFIYIVYLVFLFI